MDAASTPTARTVEPAGRSRPGGRTVLALSAVAVALAAVVLVPGLAGYERYVITSGSMSGSYDRGSLVLAKEVPVGALRVGDVITYRPPPESGARGLLTHRIVRIARDGSGRRVFATKGDANAVADPWRFTLDGATQARASFHVPYLGYGLSALSDRDVRMLFIGLPALLIALSVLAGLWRDAGRVAAGTGAVAATTTRPPRRRRLPATIAVVAAGGLALAGATLTAAGFTAATANPGNAFAASPDWTPPSVALDDPGAHVRGTVSLTATASDALSGLASVKVQRRADGATSWTDVCTDTVAPYACSLDTAAGSTPDGLYDLRAIATDDGGNSATSAVRSTRVDNTVPSVSLDLAGALRAGATMASTSGDGVGSGVVSVRYEYAPAGTASWVHACTGTTSPYSCSFATAGVTDGQYDFRAIVTDAAGNQATSASSTRWIDNGAPTSVTMQDPGSPLVGSKTFSGGASDAASGVASVKFQYRVSGGSTWSDACTATSSPYSCSFDTATLADGVYDLRALATDAAGNQANSTVVASRQLDNNGPTVTIGLPGTHFGGTQTLTATASDGQGAGVASVKIQYRPNGGSTWTDVCTDTTAPYSCSLKTNQTSETGARVTPDGVYDWRAVAVDAVAHSTNSAVAAGTIDNVSPSGADVQAINQATTAGVIEPGDKVELTYTETMRASTILSGWDGGATPVTVRFLDAAGGDRVEVYDAANTTKLALIGTNRSVQLFADYVPSSGATFGATMVQSGSKVTVTLGSLTAGAVRSTPPPAGTMEWGPSNVATDLAGNQCNASTVFELILETGILDVEF
jgi:signal peptidase I